MEEIVSSIRKKLASRVSVFTDPEINLLENLLSKEFGPPEVPFAALPNFVGGPSFPAIGGPSSVDPSAALSTSFPATGSPSSWWSPSILFNDIEFENPDDEEMLPANEILEFSLPDVDDELFVSVQNNLSVFHNYGFRCSSQAANP